MVIWTAFRFSSKEHQYLSDTGLWLCLNSNWKLQQKVHTPGHLQMIFRYNLHQPCSFLTCKTLDCFFKCKKGCLLSNEAQAHGLRARAHACVLACVGACVGVRARVNVRPFQAWW